MVKTAVVILTHGKHRLYQPLLADLLALGLPAAAVCLVHNPVQCDDWLADLPPGVEVIRMHRNVGYAAAMNAGITHHLANDAAWIWLLTHDVRLRPGAVDAMLAAVEDARDCAALGPLLVQTDTDIVFSLGGERTRWGWAYNAGNGTPLPPHRRDARTRACAWLDGSSIMLRAQALREVGLYNAEMFGYSEDADLCLRLERAGWSIRVVEAAVAEQTSGQSSRPGPVTYLLTRNGLRHARDAAGPLALAPVLAARVLESLRYARLVVTGPQRRLAVVRCSAMWLGVLAYLGRQTGPPPRWLPGSGELA